MKEIFILLVMLTGVFSFTAFGVSHSEVATNFELVKDLSLQPLDALEPIVLPAGTGIVVLEKAIVDRIQLIRLGLEYEEDLDLPQDVWVSAKEFAQAQLKAATGADPYDENGNELAASEFSRKKMTYCYRYVKQYLLSHGMVSVYLPGSSAWMAAAELPKHGFKKSSRVAASAIVNDVCVYRGGPSGHGHIEILTSKGWYYGYGYKARPIQNRTPVGCFHR